MSTRMIIRTASVLVALLLIGAPALSGAAYAGAAGGKEAVMEKAKIGEEVMLKDKKADKEKMVKSLDEEELVGEALEELGLIGIDEQAELGH